MTQTQQVSVPEPGRSAAEAFVAEHLAAVVRGPIGGSERFRGGQTAADAALAAYDVSGYRRRRNEVWPPERRGASALSPYIRHGLLPLRRVWDHVAGGPSGDVGKFRDELLWQEYARHWYARLGTATRSGVRRELPGDVGDGKVGWDRSMACTDLVVGELERDGWLVNQTRMWMASEWAVHNGAWWRAGEDEFFAHLLDGSRAANRLGWQWTTGVGSSKHYGFSRWQVNKRAPGLCDTCERRHDCPIERWPDDPEFTRVERPTTTDALLGADEVTGNERAVEAVWLTAESLGDDDPALAAHPDVRAVFVFDTPLLERLHLSGKRLVFLAETLADLATRRPVELFIDRPVDALAERGVAVTHAPVPGFARHAAAVEPAAVHPWPWLVAPTSRKIASFTAWRRSSTMPG